MVTSWICCKSGWCLQYLKL